MDAINPMEAVVELAESLGVSNVKALPGCWEEAIDETWWIALNGHREPMRCSRGVDVPPLSVYVEYNGWPAGMVTALGDGQFAAGAGANPETFAAAIRVRVSASREDDGRGAFPDRSC